MEGGAQRRHSNCSCRGSQSSPPTCARVICEVAALPGFEAVTKVVFPPLIGFIQMTHLYFVGFGVLREPVAKSEVAIETHELAKINIGNARISSNNQHVLVVIRS